MKETAKAYKEIIENYSGPGLRIMEVCGTHTHEIFRLGIRKILPESVELISGPGCPVCVTPIGYIDEAVILAKEKGAVICTFGDLIRVPGTHASLADARAEGAKIRMVYTPLDAVEYAAQHPQEQVVFLAVGFETTTPAVCLAVKRAEEQSLTNFSLLVANKTMPGAYVTLKGSADAFLYPGHVHAIIGEQICRRLAEEEGISGVIAGFTAEELLHAVAMIIKNVKAGENDPQFSYFDNCYPRVVRPEGNEAACRIIEKYMESCDSEWRGLGVIPDSGLRLRAEYQDYDARLRFGLPRIEGKPNPACRCGDVLQGKCKPSDCGVFGSGCTPQHPIGACMVSNEGACSAFYQYGL